MHAISLSIFISMYLSFSRLANLKARGIPCALPVADNSNSVLGNVDEAKASGDKQEKGENTNEEEESNDDGDDDESEDEESDDGDLD